ncbi:replication initiation protein [Hydrogenophaga sp. 2FB]|uniref:replication initiation protein n=1 Tax=Hydrogenophaga sp. 2FB TaxID=2502187 RepID=UPI001485C014|nr:replication initiation protein [Hydrogenophaga sp. 2FB]
MAKRSGDPRAAVRQISLFQNPEVPRPYKKAVQVVHSKPRAPLSLVQRKVSNAWLKNAVQTPPDSEGWWSLRISDLAEDIGFDSNNREYLRDSALELMRIVFEWDVVAPMGKRAKWNASVLFPDVQMTSDQIRYRISSQLKDQVLNPEMYAMIDMTIVKKFRKAPSLAIYEFCVRFERIGKTAEIPWQEFRDMVLGETSESKSYLEYKYFKQKVLKPSIAEVNSQADISIVLKETLAGRRIVNIAFEVSKEGPPQLAMVIDDERVLVLVGEMVKIGLLQSEARSFAGKYSPEEISAALDFLKRRMSDKRASPVENPAAYLRQALKNNWAVVDASSDPGGKPKAPAAGQASKADKLLEQYMAEQLKQAGLYFKELDPSDQDELITRYNAQQQINGLKIAKKAGKAGQIAFFTWLGMETWGHPSAEQLLSFATDRLVT